MAIPLRRRHLCATCRWRSRDQNDAMSASAIALNRFGLGARPDEPAPADPQRWLLSQFETYEALPAPWKPLPRTPALVDVWLAQQRAVRQAPDGHRSGIREAYLRQAREAYVA